MPRSVFVVGEQFSNKANLTHCRRCGKEFKKGDKILSTHNKTTRRYHFDCAEKCNLIPEIVK